MTRIKLEKETQQARVLGGFTLNGVQYESDNVIEAHPDIIKSLGSSVDADPFAVEYCLGLDKPVIRRHESIPPASLQTEDQTATTNS